LDVAEQSRKILLLGDPFPFDRLLIGRELDRVIHGVSISALELDRTPPRLCLFERVEQLEDGVKTDVSYSDESVPLELDVRNRFC